MSTIPRNSDNQPVSSFDEIKAKYGLNKGKETPTKETEKKTTEESKANANAEATTEIKTTQGKSLVDQSLNKAGITDTKIKQVREEITQEKNDAKKAERLEQKYQEISNKVDARMQTIAKAIPYINSSELNKGDGYNIKGNVVSANAMGGVRYNDEQAPNKREELFQDLMGLNQRIPNDIEVPGKETISAKVADSANIDLTKGAKNAQEAITALQDSVNALIEHTTNNNPKVQIRITRANYDQTLIGAEQAKNLLSAVMEKTGKPIKKIPKYYISKDTESETETETETETDY